LKLTIRNELRSYMPIVQLVKNSNPFLSAYKSYGINGIDSLVVGHFGEVNKGFKQLICSLAKVAAESQEAGNITPASSTDHKRKGAYALFKKRFKAALGCMAIRTQTELMIRRVQFIRRRKEAAISRLYFTIITNGLKRL